MYVYIYVFVGIEEKRKRLLGRGIGDWEKSCSEKRTFSWLTLCPWGAYRMFTVISYNSPPVFCNEPLNLWIWYYQNGAHDCSQTKNNTDYCIEYCYVPKNTFGLIFNNKNNNHSLEIIFWRFKNIFCIFKKNRKKNLNIWNIFFIQSFGIFSLIVNW